MSTALQPGEDNKEVVDLISDPPKKIPKCSCDPTKDSVWYCTACKLSFCEACDSGIHSFQAFKSHERVSVSKAPTITSLGCSEHKDEQVRFFCLTCSKPVCRDCKDSVLGKHSSHQLSALGDAVNAMNDKVSATMTTALKMFEQYSLELKTLTEKAAEQFAIEAEFFANRQKAFDSLHSSAVKELENLSLIDARFKSDLEKIEQLRSQSSAVEFLVFADECKTRFEKAVQRYVEHSAAMGSSLQILNQSYNGYGLAFQTDPKILRWEEGKFQSMILNAVQEKKLSEWLGPNLTKTRLLYRASRDGFGDASFHSKCDGRGATLTVVRSTTNHLFGGYASKPWHSRNDHGNADGSWLFTLTQDSPCKFPAKQGSALHMYGGIGYGPWFGSGKGLSLFTDSNSSMGNYTNVNGEIYDNVGRNGKTALCGAESFQTTEIEVFEVQ
eukprot:TRINITY_DN5435_c0_g1_i1.p1 TRINITY_DN5435_c0_g1~~TRINITY_DN5435_c0_g1_i1.p1  ORF type:complete len:441 (+),score=67.90 TRINITY_DN5435_c0_g1_i1:26-1348(+)